MQGCGREDAGQVEHLGRLSPRQASPIRQMHLGGPEALLEAVCTSPIRRLLLRGFSSQVSTSSSPPPLPPLQPVSPRWGRLRGAAPTAASPVGPWAWHGAGE